MSDLVQRLRTTARENYSYRNECNEAADEIERLRGLLREAKPVTVELVALLQATSKHLPASAPIDMAAAQSAMGDLTGWISRIDAALAGAAVQPTVRMGITDGWPRCLTCENDLVPGTFWCAEHQPTDPVTTSPAPAAKCACAEYYPELPHHPDCPTRNAAQQPTAPTSGGHDGD